MSAETDQRVSAAIEVRAYIYGNGNSRIWANYRFVALNLLVPK